MKQLLLVLSALFSFSFLQAQKKHNITVVSVRSVAENTAKRTALLDRSVVNGIAFRNVGPAVMSGRVVDLEVDPQHPEHFYAAFASGGIWETHNNGNSFEPVFDHEVVMTVGDIAVDWKRNIIYAGTGENNSSRSSYAGMGLYKSSDNGKNWQHLRLEETHHIGRVILHPENPDIIWVSSIGHLYTDNTDRGVYKTTDGGKTWKKTLFINEKTGVIDLVVNEKNPDELYAAAWERDRKAWNFTESGSGSGIYKSNDGGENWQLITTGNNGFPTGEGVGRIGLALCKSHPETVYAVLDNQFRRPESDLQKKEKEGLSKAKLKSMSRDSLLQLDDKVIETFLRENDFPEKITARIVKEKIAEKKIEPKALAEYLEDANSMLFDTPVVGAELYRSDDGGKTWKKTHDNYLDDLVFTYGYYFGQVSVHNDNPDKVYIVAFFVVKSDDGGKTFKNINGSNQHVDHHALWIDPANEKHLINGNDGGINITFDDGKNWLRCNTIPAGQFYAVNVDMEKPYNVYGGLQDNGVWWGSSQSENGLDWQMTGENPFKTIMEGDGMQVMVDPRDNETVYTGFQFGNYFRVNKRTGESRYITPKHELGERPLRWNWQTPIWLSEHSSDVLYMGANKVFRSLKQGDDFAAISGDLTKGGKKGDVAYGTITTLHESPVKFGLLYAGTDDGNVWVSKSGNDWENITAGLPQNYWIRTVRASKYAEGRVYVCMNGYVSDDFSSHVFVSENYGKTWTRIATDLPAEPVNVVREDPLTENLLYIGTDNGLYVSLDRGKSCMMLNNHLPAVAVHDIVVHPRDHEMVIGTHGRSIYIANVKELQQLNTETMQKEIALFAIDKIRFSKSWGGSWSYWEEASEPDMYIPVWVKSANQPVKLVVKNDNNEVLFNWESKVVKGLNYILYHYECERENYGEQKMHKGKNGKYYLTEGKYSVEVSNGKEKEEVVFEIGK